jgi:hypothetical protein
MTTLERLQAWYTQQCDELWEHRYGIKIQSCDNPGWWVHVDLKGTPLESVPFQRIAENVDTAGFQQGQRWLDCKITDGAWEGAGDETKLERILDVFLSWAETH